MMLLRQFTVGLCLFALVCAAIGSQIFAPTPKIEAIGADRLDEQRVRGVMQAEVAGIGRQSAHGWTLEVELHAIDEITVEAAPNLRLFVPGEHFDRIRPPALPGDRIEVFARLELYPSRYFPRKRGLREVMASRGVDARATALEPLEIVGTQTSALGLLERALARTRARFERHLLDGLDGQKAALAVALTTGNRAYLEPATSAPFRHTGTSHLLAISGLHLGVLAALLWWVCGALVNRCPWLLRRFGRRRVCAAFVVGLLGCYVLAIGAPVSAVRAWVMVALGAAALVWMRPLCPFHALAAAALGMIACQPAVVLDLGFQLSFSATLGILLFLRYRPAMLEPPKDPFAEPEATWRRRLRQVGLFVGVSISATLATWACVAAHFGEVALCGLVVNLVVTPLVSALLFPLLAAGALVSCVVEPVGLLVVDTMCAALLFVGDLLATVAELPGAQWVTGAAPVWAVVALAAGALVAVTSRLRVRPLVLALAMILIGLSPGLFQKPAGAGGKLEVHFIPVGQGDATFVGFPDGTTMLIDGGGSRFGRDPGRFVVVPYLRRLGVERLDWVVVTHADADHLGGLFAVVDRLRPRHLVFDAYEPEASLRALQRTAVTKGARLHAVRRRIARDFGGVRAEFVRPQVDSGVQNDGSLVARLGFGSAAVLLPGDVERAAERWLVAHEPVRASLLKVPHHGSKTSSSARFLDAVRPEFAVVSAGRFSRFGHPHADVMARYRRRQIDVFETARHGLVRVAIGKDGVIEVRVVRP